MSIYEGALLTQRTQTALGHLVAQLEHYRTYLRLLFALPDATAAA
jgi:hypothetical protein